MNTFIANNERGELPMSGEFRSVCFCLTAEALQWLSGTTSDDNHIPIANRALFYDLLLTMERIGLIAVHSSRVASVAAMTCVEGWTNAEGNLVRNHYSRADCSCE